jgi:hypothetical protein
MALTDWKCFLDIMLCQSQLVTFINCVICQPTSSPICRILLYRPFSPGITLGFYLPAKVLRLGFDRGLLTPESMHLVTAI